jgi:hypothetical protein
VVLHVSSGGPFAEGWSSLGGVNPSKGDELVRPSIGIVRRLEGRRCSFGSGLRRFCRLVLSMLALRLGERCRAGGSVVALLACEGSADWSPVAVVLLRGCGPTGGPGVPVWVDWMVGAACRASASDSALDVHRLELPAWLVRGLSGGHRVPAVADLRPGVIPLCGAVVSLPGPAAAAGGCLAAVGCYSPHCGDRVYPAVAGSSHSLLLRRTGVIPAAAVVGVESTREAERTTVGARLAAGADRVVDPFRAGE